MLVDDERLGPQHGKQPGSALEREMGRGIDERAREWLAPEDLVQHRLVAVRKVSDAVAVAVEAPVVVPVVASAVLRPVVRDQSGAFASYRREVRLHPVLDE